jgi:hypothetical protein
MTGARARSSAGCSAAAQGDAGGDQPVAHGVGVDPLDRADRGDRQPQALVEEGGAAKLALGEARARSADAPPGNAERLQTP